MEFRDVTSGGSSGQLSSICSGGDGVTIRDGGGAGGAGGGGMHHSVSTPAGVDGAARSTPPTTPKKGGKMLAIRVQMLDDTITIFQVQAKALGKVLFEQVCKQLHLLEADYFGLDYQDISGIRYWLDLQKPISRQLGLSLVDPLLFFCVKFYTPDPGQLEEEYTRYLFCLQVKRDLAQGLMQCNDNTASIMASYIVQAECGDYVMEDYPDHTYLSSYKFVPHQDREMEQRIMENHKKHAGQSPAEADLNLLETARRCELYGVKMHTTKDHENVLLNLAVAHMGIVVFQQYTKINTFSWAKIRKISFKRKRFLIKLHPEGFGYYKDTVEFFFEGRNECKNFWKKCVENHGFFRCAAVKNTSRHKTRVLSRGSSFRYSGKTQKQVVEFVRDNYVKRQTFQRSASFRHSSAHSSANNMHNTSSVGNSFSAHPLLPLVDNKSCAEAFKPSAPLDTATMNVSMTGSSSGTDTRAQPAAETTRLDSPTTRSVCRPPVIPTSWNADRTDRISNSSQPTSMSYPTSAAPIQTMSSPSPPLTMQSVSPITSTTTSPQHPLPASLWTSHPTPANLPEDDHVAVRKDDMETTGTHRRSTSSPTSSNTRNNNNPPPSQTQSQCNLETTKPYAPVVTKRKIWQRSVSCRELYDFSFEDTGQAKRRITATVCNSIAASTNTSVINACNSASYIKPTYVDELILESPITRYDDRSVIYISSRSSCLEIHQDIMMPDQKIFSNSYPGTCYPHESVEDPGNYDLRDSQEDISHDSYELIERSDDDYSSFEPLDTKCVKTKVSMRSCSLDSGNYMPSDTESEAEKRHRCKSSSDVQCSIFIMEDPRDFPREIIPRKSDGAFYKSIRQSSRTSSLESKSDYYDTKAFKSSKDSLDKTMRRKSVDFKHYSSESRRSEKLSYDSRSSVESKSDYYDADDVKPVSYNFLYDRNISFERNYGMQKAIRESHVHSVSLQNVETDQQIRSKRQPQFEQNTIPRRQKPGNQVVPTNTYIIPKYASEQFAENETAEVEQKISHATQTSEQSTEQSTEQPSDTEGNIFSFDNNQVRSYQDGTNSFHEADGTFGLVHMNKVEPKKNYRDVFIEIEPRKLNIINNEPMALHQPIERTKSDPNSLARQRSTINSRRLLLKHQKSIDLTPAESSDEDYLYKQIPPSAPPIISRYRGTQFEIPTAEFGHFDVLKRDTEGQKSSFEVPKRQFQELGAENQADLTNLVPSTDINIPYTLHKRHIMNGTSKEEIISQISNDIDVQEVPSSPPDGDANIDCCNSSFLFTQNIDLSKLNPVTLEIDQTIKPIHHLSSPKRDITRIDPALLETLNSKLSQIESDSPTSSRTDSIKPIFKSMVIQATIEEMKQEDIKSYAKTPDADKPSIKLPVRDKIKEGKPKRVIKPRMQPGKKGKSNKSKVRITSFSSDDESLDSDDVFGSAEATPTKVEFSPPQMRKEMESILKYESERKYLQYTMSSTEIEGSPPTTRRSENLYDRTLDPAYQTELRRISERSLSIPSSEDEFNIKVTDMQPVFEPDAADLTTVEELDREEFDKSIDDAVEQVTIQELLQDADLIAITEQNELEKQLLNEDIERDIRDLLVPSRTKITEIPSPSMRRRGRGPVKFAHARLNLSEGSAFSLLQKQQAIDSPLRDRRSQSLDAPIIQVYKLPPLNSVSSKDDTVDEEDYTITNINRDSFATETEDELVQAMSSFENRSFSRNSPANSEFEIKNILAMETDQIVPDLSEKNKKIAKKLDLSKPGQTKIVYNVKDIRTSPTRILKTISKNEGAKKENSRTNLGMLPLAILSTQSSLGLPEIKRTKSQEIESCNQRPPPTEKAKSLEKLEFKRTSSRERTKSQDDSDTDIVKRKEKQQMLYEIAIKQSLKSPVKDTLPVFPQVEEMVRERHGKLEISINTIETDINLEEAIIITKSPKKLDRKMAKSLELNYTDEESSANSVTRLGVSLDIDNQDDMKRSESSFSFEARSIKKFSDSTGQISPKLFESTDKHEVTAMAQNIIEKDKVVSPTNTSEIATPEKSDTKDKDNEVLFEDVDPQDFKKASKIVKKHVLQRLALKRQLVAKELLPPPVDTPTKIASEEESLTEVSDLQDQDSKKTLKKEETNIPYVPLKHSIEQGFSEDTGSWMTVECDEYVGNLESLDLDNVTQKIDTSSSASITPKASFDKASSSEGPKLSGTDALTPQSSKDLPSSSSTLTSDKEDICEDKYDFKKPVVSKIYTSKTSARDPMDISPASKEFPKSPRSPRICVLGRTFTIDEGMKMPLGHEVDNGNDVNDQCEFNISDPSLVSNSEKDTLKYTRSAYPFEEKWSNNSELSQKLHNKLSKKLSSGDKCSMSSVEDSLSDQRKSCKSSFEKPPHSFENVSTDSRNSIDTESSSGSLGMITRLQKSDDAHNKALSSTWKPFPLESSGSSSIEDGMPGLPPDYDANSQEYFLSKEDCEFTMLTDVHRADFSASSSRPMSNEDKMRTFNQSLQGLGSEMMANTMFLSRTLSRISERSTNSEKSSIEEDSAKASTQSSAHEETLSGAAPQSKSSESECKILNISSKKEIIEQYPTVNNLLQRQISDDRRTSAEMADLSMDDIEILTSERGLRLRRQDSDDTIIEDDIHSSQQNIDKRGSRESSQDSEEWPLPEIPIQKLAYYDTPSTDTSQHTILTLVPNDPNIPKIFGLKGSLRSQDSEQWPSPPSSVIDPPIVGNVETQFVTRSEEASKVLVDSSTVSTYDNESNSFSDSDNKTLEDLEGDKTHTYENVATEHISESLSESYSIGPSGVKIIVEKKSEHSDSNSDEIGNDDVFDAAEPPKTGELRPQTAMRHSTTSDESSISGQRGELKVPSPKHSHSSYSDEDQSSSLGTALEDDTVRYALNRSKCTHSSHSEDTSIALSLSEWSNSTNTVKFQNLSTSKSATNSSGLKSDENSLTDLAQSMSERSTSNSTLKAQAQSIQLKKLSSSTGDSSTLTEKLPTLSEWSKSDPKPLGARHYYTSSIPERLFSRISGNIPEASIPEPLLTSRIIPSEQDMPGIRPDTTYLKCTERPVIIPTTILSDNEKSTESSSIEQKTVHMFRNDKQKYFKNQTQSKSTDRSVKGPMKLSKCSPYYSSSLSSESTPMTTSAIPPMSKTATVPLTRTHRKSVPKCVFPCRSPPSENDSTSSMESAKTKSESRDRRGHRRRRQTMPKRQKSDKDLRLDPETSQYNEYIRNRSLEELSHGYGGPNASLYTENSEEGYYPDGDSQSGSDIFRMERDDDRLERAESFDVSSIPPPLLEDDFELVKQNNDI